jgi:hypothetical protein
MLGVTPQMVDKIQGRLTLIKVKGKKKLQIDLHGAATIQYLADREAALPLPEPETEQQTEPVEDPVPESVTVRKIRTNPSNPSGLPNPLNKTKRELEEEKLKETIEKLHIDNQQSRGNLIEKKLVELLFGKIHQIDDDQFKSSGVDLSKRVLAIFNEKTRKKSTELLEIIKKDTNITQKKIESILNSDDDVVKLKIMSVWEDITGDVLKSVQRETDSFLTQFEHQGDDAPI